MSTIILVGKYFGGLWDLFAGLQHMETAVRKCDASHGDMDKLVADLKRILEEADPGITVAETLQPELRQEDGVEPALPFPEEKRRLT